MVGLDIADVAASPLDKTKYPTAAAHSGRLLLPLLHQPRRAEHAGRPAPARRLAGARAHAAVGAVLRQSMAKVNAATFGSDFG